MIIYLFLQTDNIPYFCGHHVVFVIFVINMYFNKSYCNILNV